MHTPTAREMSARWLLIATLVSLPLVARSDDRPNIVLILADDLGWSDLACYGHEYHRTPNIDGLARQGMLFADGYSPAPICSAARASILTGKTVARLGFEFVTKHEPGHQKLDAVVPLETPAITLNLPLSEQTIAERLGELKYHTAFFGKWHVSQHYQRQYLAWHPDFGPRRQGFAIAEEDFGDHPYAWRRKQPHDADDGVIPDDTMIGKAGEFIRSHHERPFFVMVSSFYVHTPVRNRCRWLVEHYRTEIPAEAPNRSKRLEYAAFVETLDHHVGVILDAIDASGQRDNTLVLFTSDNGGHPEYCSNAPLRGSKWNLYEGGIRVPLIARWPGRVKSASTCKTPLIGYDLLPTLVDVAGGSADDVDGESFFGSFDAAAFPSRSLIWHFPYYHPETTFSSAIDEIGINDFATSKTRPQSAIRSGRYKLIKFAEDDRVELYDLGKDIGEQHDLSGQLTDVADELEHLLENQLTTMNARKAIPVKH